MMQESRLRRQGPGSLRGLPHGKTRLRLRVTDHHPPGRNRSTKKKRDKAIAKDLIRRKPEVPRQDRDDPKEALVPRNSSFTCVTGGPLQGPGANGTTTTYRADHSMGWNSTRNDLSRRRPGFRSATGRLPGKLPANRGEYIGRIEDQGSLPHCGGPQAGKAWLRARPIVSSARTGALKGGIPANFNTQQSWWISRGGPAKSTLARTVPSVAEIKIRDRRLVLTDQGKLVVRPPQPWTISRTRNARTGLGRLGEIRIQGKSGEARDRANQPRLTARRPRGGFRGRDGGPPQSGRRRQNSIDWTTRPSSPQLSKCLATGPRIPRSVGLSCFIFNG